MALPLSGIRVVEMCQVYAGPYAAMLMADQGADVIKLEPPEGDSSRGGANKPPPPGVALPFLSFNRNKRSIVVNIQTPSGRNVAYKLFQWADVLIIATRVATRGRWGFTYEDVAAVNPRLIYASITGFGEQGPDFDLPGVDVVIQPRSGDSAFRRAPGGPPPSTVGLYHFDMATSMLTLSAVLLALRQRDSTGRGQKLELSLLQSALASHSVNMTRVLDGSPASPTPANVFRIYLCSDGRYIFASPTANRWPDFCRALGLDQLIEDARFDTVEKRRQNGEALYQILMPHFATRPAVEWEARLKAADEYVSVVQEMAEVYDDPQVVANHMVTRFEQPGVGTVEAVNIPFKMSANAGEPWLHRPVPALGENTQEILSELGYGQREVASLRAEKAVG